MEKFYKNAKGQIILGAIPSIGITNSLQQYELDDGPLTHEQIQQINDISTATNIPNKNFTKNLFDNSID